MAISVNTVIHKIFSHSTNQEIPDNCTQCILCINFLRFFPVLRFNFKWITIIRLSGEIKIQRGSWVASGVQMEWATELVRFVSLNLVSSWPATGIRTRKGMQDQSQGPAIKGTHSSTKRRPCPVPAPDPLSAFRFREMLGFAISISPFFFAAGRWPLLAPLLPLCGLSKVLGRHSDSFLLHVILCAKADKTQSPPSFFIFFKAVHKI